MKLNIFGRSTSPDGAEAREEAKERKLIIKKYRCPQNHPCPSIRVCPVGALTQTGYQAPVVDADKCILCGKCVKFCPMRAIALQ